MFCTSSEMDIGRTSQRKKSVSSATEPSAKHSGLVKSLQMYHRNLNVLWCNVAFKAHVWISCWFFLCDRDELRNCRAWKELHLASFLTTPASPCWKLCVYLIIFFFRAMENYTWATENVSLQMGNHTQTLFFFQFKSSISWVMWGY